MNNTYRYIYILVNIFILGNLQAQEQVALPPAPEAAAMKEYVDVPVNMYAGIPQVSIPIHALQGREITVPISLSYHANGVRVAEEASWVGLGWSLSAGGMITREIRDNDDFGEINFWDGGAERSLPFETTVGNLPKAPDNPGSNQFTIYDDLETSAILENCDGFLGGDCTYETIGGGASNKQDFCGEVYSSLGQVGNTTQSRVDTEPDLFTFSFGGYSGKFVYDHIAQKYVPMSGDAITIIRMGTFATPYWEVTTPDGKRYIFGETAEGRQLQYSISFSLRSNGKDGSDLTDPTCDNCFDDPSEYQKRSYISTWYLQRIEAPNGDLMEFDYDTDKVVFHTAFAQSNQSGIRPVPNYSDYLEDRLKICQEAIETIYKGILGGSCLEPALPLAQEALNRTITRVAYDQITLSAIRGEYGKIEFLTSERADLLGGVKLDAINIFSGGAPSYNLTKTFAFSYDYFDSSEQILGAVGKWTDYIKPSYSRALPNNFQEDHFNLRLQLTAVQEVGGDGSTSIPPHKFTYFEGQHPTTGVDQTLPPKSSFAVDKWGYHNNVRTNRLLLPSLQIDEVRLQSLLEEFDNSFPCTNSGIELPIFQGADRNPDPDYAGGWLLKDVGYPTEGKLNMEYEANEYAIPPSWKKKPQGSRIGLGFDEFTGNFVWENTLTVSTDRPTGTAPIDATVYVGYFLSFDEDNPCSPCPIAPIGAGSRKLPYIRITPTDGSSPAQQLTEGDMVVGDPWGTESLCISEGFNTDECGYEGPMISKTVSLIPGKTYEVEIYVITPCGYRQLPCDLIEFQVSVEWDEYELIDREYGGGARISRSELEDGKGQTITKLYKYPLTSSNGSPSAKLLNEPKFEYEYFTIYPGGTFCGGALPYISTLESHRYSNSQVPLQSGYAGSFVGYSEVEVWQGENKENGWSKYLYHNQPTVYSFGINAEPPNFSRHYDQMNGSLLQKLDYQGGGETLVHEIKNTYENEFLDEIWSLNLFTFSDPRSWGGIAPDPNTLTCPENRNQFYYYKNVRQWVKLLSTEETHYFYADNGSQNGKVIKTSEFTYNDENFAIATSSFVDSDGREYTTEYYYPVGSQLDGDLIASATALDDFNIKNTVLENRLLTGSQQVGGNKATFTKVTLDKEYIVPETLYQWEGMSWDPIGTFTAYYEDAFPRTFQKNYYTDPDEFEWYGYGNFSGEVQKRGLLARKVYKEFEWEFDYKPENRRLAKRTEPDDTYTQFEYDGLQRLHTATAYGNNDAQKNTTTVTYQYGSPAGDGNNVSSKIEYADGTPTKESIKYYDGLGRYYKTLTKGFYQNSVDVVTDELMYDDFGRIEKQTFLIGNLKELEYEPSPLNRLVQETLPDGHTLGYTYGAEGQGPGAGENTYYTVEVSESVTENYLSGSTTKGIKNKTVTDKQGRQFKNVNARGEETVFYYDDYGNVERIVTPESSEYLYVYDDQNRLESKAIPGGGTTTYDYLNDRDLLLSHTDGNGIKISLEYDDYDRIIKTFLGEVGGERLTENIYYTQAEGHVDKIKQSINKILWEDTPADTKDTYIYDSFGRVEQHTYEHILGSDVIVNTLNYADQVENMALNHNGHESLNIGIGNTFDRYDRVKSVSHQIEGYGSVSLSSGINYNTRGQLINKTIGGGLFTYDYGYSDTRGWLERINEELPSDLTLPTCEFEEPEDVVPPLNIDLDPFFDELPFNKLLKVRFETSLNLNFVNQPRPCPVAPCTIPGTPCTSSTVDQDYAAINATLKEKVSVQKEVPCADGTTEVIDVISTDPIFLPTRLYRIRFCDGSEAYVLAAYLAQITVDYAIVQDLVVSDAAQKFQVSVGGQEGTYTFTELLQLLIDGIDIIVGDYVPCGQPNCNLEPSCSAGEIAAQQAALQQLQDNLENIQAENLTYPVYLYAVQLCNSEVLYVLEGELEILEQTSISVIDTLIFQGPEESKPIAPTPPEKDFGPGGLFHMKFAYQPNGNIDEMYWQVAGRALSEYDMSYDLLNRITNAQFNEYSGGGSQRSSLNAYGVNGITYDEDGNLLTLQRRGLIGYCENGLPEYGGIDDLAYTYTGLPNQLTSVTDGAAPDKGFKSSGGGNYGYDGTGNITSDPNKGLSITYNHLNLPESISGNGGTITIVYDAAGRKLQKVVTSPEENYTLDYISGVEYRNEELEAVYTEEGRFFVPAAEEGDEPADPRYEFFLKDHLGNTRVVIADLDGSGSIDITDDLATNEVLQENHYYPFGMNQEGPWALHPERSNEYQYNGKELNEDLGLNWLDYGARWYDPSIGRWNAVDPLAEKMASWSPYNYTFNNPLKFTDPTGMAPDWIPEYDEKLGVVTYTSEDGDSYQTFVSQYGEEAAEEAFGANCDECFNKNETFSDGDMILNSDKAYKLIVREEGVDNQLIDMFVGGSGKETTTEIQDIYNQIQLASSVSDAKGDGTFTMSEFFTRPDGGNVESFSVSGSVTIKEGYTYNKSAIEYSSDLATGGRRISTTFREGQLANGFKQEYRIGYKVPLLLTFRTK